MGSKPKGRSPREVSSSVDVRVNLDTITGPQLPLLPGEVGDGPAGMPPNPDAIEELRRLHAKKATLQMEKLEKQISRMEGGEMPAQVRARQVLAKGEGAITALSQGPGAGAAYLGYQALEAAAHAGPTVKAVASAFRTAAAAGATLYGGAKLLSSNFLAATTNRLTESLGAQVDNPVVKAAQQQVNRISGHISGIGQARELEEAFIKLGFEVPKEFESHPTSDYFSVFLDTFMQITTFGMYGTTAGRSHAAIAYGQVAEAKKNLNDAMGVQDAQASLRSFWGGR